MQSRLCKVEPVVASELDAEDAELVTLHGVLQWAARGVHAVEGGHQRVLVDSLHAQISNQNMSTLKLDSINTLHNIQGMLLVILTRPTNQYIAMLP